MRRVTYHTHHTRHHTIRRHTIAATHYRHTLSRPHNQERWPTWRSAAKNGMSAIPWALTPRSAAAAAAAALGTAVRGQPTTRRGCCERRRARGRASRCCAPRLSVPVCVGTVPGLCVGTVNAPQSLKTHCNRCLKMLCNRCLKVLCNRCLQMLCKFSADKAAAADPLSKHCCGILLS
jgi:hypothetical protein